MFFVEKDPISIELFPVLFIDDDESKTEEKFSFDDSVRQKATFNRDDSEHIPILPDEYYLEAESVDDELSRGIREIEVFEDSNDVWSRKVFRDLLKEISSKKLSFMVKIEGLDRFIQFCNIETKNSERDDILLQEDDPISQHLCVKERVSYVADISKITSIFQNIDLQEEFSPVESLIIFPFRIEGTALILLFLGFDEAVKEKIEEIINIVMINYKEKLEQEVLALI